MTSMTTISTPALDELLAGLRTLVDISQAPGDRLAEEADELRRRDVAALLVAIAEAAEALGTILENVDEPAQQYTGHLYGPTADAHNALHTASDHLRELATEIDPDRHERSGT